MLATHAAPAPAYVGIEEDDRRTPWRLDASRPRVRVAQGRARRRVVFSNLYLWANGERIGQATAQFQVLG